VKIYGGLGESADDIRLPHVLVGNFSANDVSDLYNAIVR
jgi:hypothetical protein